MIKRIRRISLSFLAVLGLYWCYALAVVPWIEPRPQPSSMPLDGSDFSYDQLHAANPFRELLAPYFPPGHWALDYPKVIKSDKALLLLEDWHPQPDGLLELDRCALIFFPTGTSGGVRADRDAVILEAPHGATLQFDRLDLSRARLGKLQHGCLVGPVTIRSDMKKEGPEDDLKITTAGDVFLSQTRIWTPDGVTCHLGRSKVVGRDMEIRLIAAPGGGSGTAVGLQVSGIRSFALKQEVDMTLVAAGAEVLSPGQFAGPLRGGAPGEAAGAPRRGAEPPLRIRCRGPFRFDAVRHVARFRDRVLVERLRDAAAPDRLWCYELSIEMSEARAPQVGAEPRSDRPGSALTGSLRPRRIVAVGAPVRVDSPATESSARCQQLDYDVDTRRIALSSRLTPESAQETILIQGPNQWHAASFQYQPSDRPRGIPQMESEGPGWLVATSRDDPSRRFTAKWGRRMALKRHRQEPVLSMWGAAALALDGSGSIAADELHLYLKEAPGRALGPNLPDVLPDRMRAISADRTARNVRIAAPSFSADVNEMRLWFVERQAAAAPASSTERGGPAGGGPPSRGASGPSQGSDRRSRSQADAYVVGADMLQAEIAIGQGDPAVRNVTLDRHVEIRQAAVRQAGQRPLILRGDALNVRHADQPRMQVTLRGAPALMGARELTLRGPTIELDRGENRLWVASAGSMSVRIERGQSGRSGTPLQAAGPLHVTWAGRMDFDGQTVTFTRDVQAYDRENRLRTESLTAVLNRPVRFDADRPAEGGGELEIRLLRSPVPVTLQRHTTEGKRLASRERMAIRNLSIDRMTGEIAGQGPGYVASVRLRGTQDWMAAGRVTGGAGAAPDAPAAATEGRAAAAPGLEYLRVDFQRAIEGNLHRRALTFVGKVRATYGPVDHWEATIDVDSPEGLGQDGVMSTSDRLSVREIRLDEHERGTLEIEAAGNAVVEGRSFFARARTMRYAQAKELIVLEGDGRTSAKLWQQKRTGQQPARFAARQIFYWRRDGRVRVADANILTLPVGQNVGRQ